MGLGGIDQTAPHLRASPGRSREVLDLPESAGALTHQLRISSRKRLKRSRDAKRRASDRSNSLRGTLPPAGGDPTLPLAVLTLLERLLQAPLASFTPGPSIFVRASREGVPPEHRPG